MNIGFLKRAGWALIVLLTSLATYLGYELRYAQVTSDGMISLARAEEAKQYAAVCKGKIDVEGGVIKLAPSRDGVITEVLTEEGNFVKKGQVLARIDDNEAKLQLEVAKKELSRAEAVVNSSTVKLASAEREFRRATGLFKGNVSPKIELDQAHDTLSERKSELEEARAASAVKASEVAVAQYEVSQREIKAPYDGRIVRRNARLGDGASTFNVTALFLFAPDAPRIVRADLDESFISKVEVGMRAMVVLEADDRQTFEATVKRVGSVVGQKQPDPEDPTIKPDSRSTDLVLDIDAEKLKIGQRVVVYLYEPGS